MTPTWHPITTLEALVANKAFTTTIKGRPVAVYKLDNGEVYAIEDMCTHQGLPVSDGPCFTNEEGPQVECPFHGARFCLKTGAVTAPPAFAPITTFPVRVDTKGQIEIEV